MGAGASRKPRPLSNPEDLIHGLQREMQLGEGKMRLAREHSRLGLSARGRSALCQVTRRMHLRRALAIGWIVVVGFALVAALVIEILFGPLSLIADAIRISTYRRELRAALARWESSGISDYSIDVSVFAPPLCTYDASLTVRDDEAVSATLWRYRSNPRVAAQGMESFWAEYCPTSRYTVSAMFRRAEQDLRSIDLAQESLRMSFDPQFGFIIQCEDRYLGSRGLLAPATGDRCPEYTFTNFVPMEPPPS